MKCCIGTCSRKAVVKVTFAETGAIWVYCHWHGYDRHGNLRWKPDAVQAVEAIR